MEVTRQALLNPSITSVVALARRPVVLPQDTYPTVNTSKLQTVTLEDWTSPYPAYVKEELSGANACIWSEPP